LVIQLLDVITLFDMLSGGLSEEWPNLLVGNRFIHYGRQRSRVFGFGQTAGDPVFDEFRNIPRDARRPPAISRPWLRATISRPSTRSNGKR
jgi:hypothetical protein